MTVLIQSLITVVDMLLYFYSLLIIGRVIISWVSPDPFNPIVNFLHITTEPVMRYARKIIPPIGGTVDISPIAVLILIHVVRNIIIQLLVDLQHSL